MRARYPLGRSFFRGVEIVKTIVINSDEGPSFRIASSGKISNYQIVTKFYMLVR